MILSRRLGRRLKKKSGPLRGPLSTVEMIMSKPQFRQVSRRVQAHVAFHPQKYSQLALEVGMGSFAANRQVGVAEVRNHEDNLLVTSNLCTCRTRRSAAENQGDCMDCNAAEHSVGAPKTGDEQEFVVENVADAASNAAAQPPAKSWIAVSVCPGSSSCGMWPHSSITSILALGRSFTSRLPKASGTIRSCAHQMSSVGVFSVL